MKEKAAAVADCVVEFCVVLYAALFSVCMFLCVCVMMTRYDMVRDENDDDICWWT